MKSGINYQRLGLNIRHYRHTRQITQIELAELVGCSVGTISKLEHGQYKPSVELIFQVAHALGCRASELVEGV